MPVHPKSLTRRDEVLIHHPQAAKARLLRIEVVRKREGVMRLQPAVIGVAAVLGMANSDHAPLFAAGTGKTNAARSLSARPPSSPSQGPERALIVLSVAAPLKNLRIPSRFSQVPDLTRDESDLGFQCREFWWRHQNFLRWH